MDELIQQARGGDEAAREQLLTMVRPRLRQWAEQALNTRYGARMDASDLAQITLVDVYEQLAQFLGTTEGEFMNWLHTVLNRNVVDAVRKATAQKRNIANEQWQSKEADGDGSPERNQIAAVEHSSPSMKAIRNEESDRLVKALEQLSPDHRMVVKLVHLEGCSIAKAAEQLQRTTAATAKLLQRGMANLRQVLQETTGE